MKQCSKCDNSGYMLVQTKDAFDNTYLEIRARPVCKIFDNNNAAVTHVFRAAALHDANRGYDSLVDVGNPICEQGHDMELCEEND